MGVREGLLVLLAEKPRHGYDIRAEFDRRTADLWALNSGQVYTTLDRMTRDGLVTASPDENDPSGRRKLYALTGPGRTALTEWLAGLPATTEPPREDLVMAVLLTAERPLADALAVVDAARGRILKHLQEIRRGQRTREAGSDIGADLVSEVLIARMEADLRWLDRTEQILANRRPAAAVNREGVQQ